MAGTNEWLASANGVRMDSRDKEWLAEWLASTNGIRRGWPGWVNG